MSGLVECQSGYAHATRPLAVTWQAERLEVTEILAEWRTPQAKLFRVRTGDGRLFELACPETSGEWTIRQL